MTYPEHDKLSAIADQSQAIGEFMEWLKDGARPQQPRLFLAHYVEGEECPVPLHTPTEDLLAEYFEIDQSKLEQEKRAMLDSLRARHDQATAQEVRGA